MDRSLVRLMAFSVGAATASSYYNQAFLGHVAHEFGLTAGTVVLLPVVTQLGNAAGILFLAPLGDRLERRSFIMLMCVALVAMLAAGALAPGFAWVVAASAGIGLFATVSQHILAMALHLAPARSRGSILGRVSAGLLAGILLARVVSGVISDLLGWRHVLGLAAMLMIAVGALLAARLPTVRPATQLNYLALLASLRTLLLRHALLRRAVAVQFLLFAAFMTFWANLAVLLGGPPFGAGATAVGVLSLIGIGGAFAAPLAGHAADRSGPVTVVAAGAVLVVAAFLILLVWGGTWTGLCAGILVLDLGIQGSQIANQSRVSALDAGARSRINAIFMATMLSGGAAGAATGGMLLAASGWPALCAFGAGAAGLALLIEVKAR
jgi:predicted MFS family arabinose efflux permease